MERPRYWDYGDESEYDAALEEYLLEKSEEYFLERMKEAAELSKGDEELGHSHADGVLCDFLIYLGHPEIVKEFKKVDKWYS